MQLFWHQTPLFRIAIPLILGVGLGFYLPNSQLFFYEVLALVSILLGVYFSFSGKWKYYKNRFIVGGILNVGFFLVGTLLSTGQELLRTASLEMPPSAEIYGAELLDYPHRGENSVRLDLSVQEYKNGENSEICKPVRIYAYTDPELELDTLMPGDLVFFPAYFSQKKQILNPGQFDYAAYLRNKGIAATIFLDKEVFANRPVYKPFRLMVFFKDVQNYCVDVFAEFNIPQRELGIASALILGKRSLVDPMLKSEYAAVGAVHILAVSGLHVGIIYIVIIGLLGRIFKAKKWRWLIFLITVIFLWFYAGITGFSPSVLRATVMFSFVALGKIYDNRANIYNMLAASAIVLVVVNPLIIKEVGFQLSYCAVLGIAYFFTPLYQLRVFKYWIPDKIWSLLVLAVAAQVSTFPLSIYYFGQFPNYFLPVNIIVIPAAMISLYSGLLLLVTHWIPWVSDFFAWVLKWTLWSLNTCIEWISGLPMAISDHLHFSIAAVVLLYLLVVQIANLLVFPSRRNLGWIFAVFILLLGMWNYRTWKISQTVQVSVLKGFKTDAICLQNGMTAYILLNDTSSAFIKKNRYSLDGYFDKKGIRDELWIPFDAEVHLQTLAGEDGIFNFDGHALAVPTSTGNPGIAQELGCSFILIQNDAQIEVSNLENLNATLILSSNLSYYARKNLIAKLQKEGIDYWDMETQGIYMLE